MRKRGQDKSELVTRANANPAVEDLESAMLRFKSALLANLIINWIVSFLRLKDTLLGTSVATATLALSLYIADVAVSLLFNRSRPMIIYTAMACLLTAISFGIIKVLHDGIFIPGRLPLTLPALVSADQKTQELRDWFNHFLSMRTQVAVSLAFACSSIPTLVCFETYTSTKFKAGSYLLAFLCMFAVGHGAYCATKIPTLLKTISRQRMILFWLSPADTKWIKEASWIFTKLSLADSFIAAIGLIGLYLMRPSASSVTASVALLWLIIALATIIYTFVYPHHYLNKIIRTEKEAQITKMQHFITTRFETLENMSDEEARRYMDLIRIYRILIDARETAIDFRAWSGFIPSIALPTLSYFGKGLIEIGKRAMMP